MRGLFSTEHFKKSVYFVIWSLIYLFVYMVITIIILEMFTHLPKTSENFMQLQEPGDFVFLIGTVIIAIAGLIMFYRYLKDKNNNKMKFWLGQFGFGMLYNSVLFFITQTSMMQFSHLNLKSVKEAIKFVNLNFWVSMALTVLAMLLLLYINFKKQWLKKNNWYYFVTFAPSILELGLIYHYQISWLNVMNISKHMSMNTLYALIVGFHHFDHNFSVLMIDSSSEPIGICMLIATAVTVYIGGESLVWKWQKANQSRKAKVEAKQKES